MLVDLSSFLNGATRVVVVGIGSGMRGDDAAGIEVLRRLRGRLRSPNVLLIDGGVAPENFTSQIRRFRPSHIIFVDATEFGAKPGDVVIADPGAITGQSVSTHTIPLSALAGYLKEQTGADIILIGIQPSQIDMGAKISDVVKVSVSRVFEILTEKLISV